MSAAPVCGACRDTGHVCENHPRRPWEGFTPPPECCDCGGAGMPCPSCCDPIPQDGRHSIREAFIPRHLRQVAA
jgi:hypothetical protein